jgi:hypothetical protein
LDFFPNVWQKVAQTVSEPKSPNISIKAQFVSPKHLCQLTFETNKYQQQAMFLIAYSVESVKNML